MKNFKSIFFITYHDMALQSIITFWRKSLISAFNSRTNLKLEANMF